VHFGEIDVLRLESPHIVSLLRGYLCRAKGGERIAEAHPQSIRSLADTTNFKVGWIGGKNDSRRSIADGSAVVQAQRSRYNTALFILFVGYFGAKMRVGVEGTIEVIFDGNRREHALHVRQRDFVSIHIALTEHGG
jgi:hypothetical protein